MTPTSSPSLARALADGVVVLDGGLATALEARGHDLSSALWSARLLLDRPEAVVAAHRDFFAAGAQVATTASYQVSFPGFAAQGLGPADTTSALRRSVELAERARSAMPPDRVRWVAASVGPYGAALADGSEYRGTYGRSVAELRAWHRPRLQTLMDTTADVLALETIPCLAEVEALLAEVDGTGAPCWLSLTCTGATTRAGEPVDEAFAMAADVPEVVAVGATVSTPPTSPSSCPGPPRSAANPPWPIPTAARRGCLDRAWHGPPAFAASSVQQWTAAGARLVVVLPGAARDHRRGRHRGRCAMSTRDLRPTNWAGNVVDSAARFSSLSSVPELHELVASSERIRARGTGHSFNAIADTTGDSVSLAAMPAALSVNTEPDRHRGRGGPLRRARGVRCRARSRPAQPRLAAAHLGGRRLRDRHPWLGARPTAFWPHRFGARHGHRRRLAGARQPAGRRRRTLAGSVIGLGSLGIVTTLTLDVVPTFYVRQVVYDDLPEAELDRHFDEILSAAYSVSLFSTWDEPSCHQAWLEASGRRPGRSLVPRASWTGRAAGRRRLRQMTPGLPPVNCTLQEGVAGPWHERLAHFRVEFTPSSGDELQSEYFVPRDAARDAWRALRMLAPLVAPVVQSSEIRTVAADDLWISPAHERDSVAFHFTWLARRRRRRRGPARGGGRARAVRGTPALGGRCRPCRPRRWRGSTAGTTTSARCCARATPGASSATTWWTASSPADRLWRAGPAGAGTIALRRQRPPGRRAPPGANEGRTGVVWKGWGHGCHQTPLRSRLVDRRAGRRRRGPAC